MNEIQGLEQNSLRSFKRLFMTLSPPKMDFLQGVFEAEFVGPAWLRWSAGPSLILGGLRGWWGKELDGVGQGVNIVRRGGAFERVLPMVMRETLSLVDGQAGVSLTYPPGSPFPWPLIVDELRCIDEKQLLALTIVNVKGLRRAAFPFVLHHREQDSGL